MITIPSIGSNVPFENPKLYLHTIASRVISLTAITNPLSGGIPITGNPGGGLPITGNPGGGLLKP